MFGYPETFIALHPALCTTVLRDTKKLQEASCATLSPSDKRRDPLAYNDRLQP